MVEVIAAIAMLCQVTGTGGDMVYTYEKTKARQAQCYQTLLKCLESESAFGVDTRLKLCVLKGGY